MAIDDLSTIDASKENWCIVAKVNRLWLSPSLYGSKLPFSMDMILMDEKGCKIHASVRRTLIYRFQSLLSEGRVYQISFFGVGESGRDFRPTSHPFKINFDIHTSVRLVPNKTIDLSPYNFVPISDIMFKDLDTSFLIANVEKAKKVQASSPWDFYCELELGMSGLVEFCSTIKNQRRDTRKERIVQIRS
ncbi:uncharacterized protein LOC130713081 [Lotus japonicus]|uniref:uncharacterized protein LOC130713081 n=1 Tax=Lotus japonicus TaxID=34305 RepID=UPI002588E922|nr:uncharacterized protein LOC130713081 [Lotus japonicus]